jgi:hypothetical protein
MFCLVKLVYLSSGKKKFLKKIGKLMENLKKSFGQNKTAATIF